MFPLPPDIDRRKLQDLINQMKSMVPHYTKEWKFTPEQSEQDPGVALFYSFADLFLKNIERLNRVPMKNYIAFLNLLDVTQSPAKPAEGYVTFKLAEGAKEDVPLPKGTQVSADTPNGPALFSTMDDLLLTTALPIAGYQLDGNQDRFVEMPAALWSGKPDEMASWRLFDFNQATNLQDHVLYLGHQSLLQLKGGAAVTVAFGNTQDPYKESYIQRLADKTLVEWSYSTKDGWQRFPDVTANGNKLVLTKDMEIDIEPQTVNSVEKRWLRCRVLPGQFSKLSVPDQGNMEINSIRLLTQMTVQEDGVVPSRLFGDDVELKADDCLPFREFFVQNSMFYISQDEVFAKQNSLITLSFDVNFQPHRLRPEQPVDWKLIMKKTDVDHVPDPVSISRVLWEYWDGEAWVQVPLQQPGDLVFYSLDGTEQRTATLQFVRPSNWQPIPLQSRSSYWMRARILEINNLYSSDPLYLTPEVKKVRLRYAYSEDNMQPVESCLTLNNQEWRERTADVTSTSSQAFPPFYGLDAQGNAVYLGFDRPFQGITSLFLSMQPSLSEGAATPCPVKWQYRRNRTGTREWAALDVIDDTEDLTESGTIRLMLPADFTSEIYFEKELYWIRMVENSPDQTGTSSDSLPVLKKIVLNTVHTVQQEETENETPDPSGINGANAYVLSRKPIFDEEVWVEETDALTHAVLEQLPPEDVQAFYDTDGQLLKGLVRWTRVPDFSASGPEDRHYLIDLTEGLIQFGDGMHGKRPPDGSHKINVNYKRTAGENGNVDALKIKDLPKSIAFVDSVYNLEPSGGGCEQETRDEALVRGPQIIQHRQRAVTAGDYEQLAREADQDIVKAKCFANVNAAMHTEPGAVTVVVYPRGGLAAMPYFSGLRSRTEQDLRERSALVIAPKKVQVIAPDFWEVSVQASITVLRPEAMLRAKQQALQLLESFLDPMTGNYDHNGWAIGQQVNASMFEFLLRSVPDVSAVGPVVLNICRIGNDGQRIELPERERVRVRHCMVLGGQHQIDVFGT